MTRLHELTADEWHAALAEMQAAAARVYLDARDTYETQHPRAEVSQRYAANLWLQARELIDEA